jgi:3-hydroxybutyryl-CoA dehydrogenase
MAIQRVGVIGAGTMGNGIAHVFARCGFNVVLCDVEQRFLDRGLATIAKNLDREVAKNKITADDKLHAGAHYGGGGSGETGGLRSGDRGGDGEI